MSGKGDTQEALSWAASIRRKLLPLLDSASGALCQISIEAKVCLRIPHRKLENERTCHAEVVLQDLSTALERLKSARRDAFSTIKGQLRLELVKGCPSDTTMETLLETCRRVSAEMLVGQHTDRIRIRSPLS